MNGYRRKSMQRLADHLDAAILRNNGELGYVPPPSTLPWDIS
jgi:hypothetical protein